MEGIKRVAIDASRATAMSDGRDSDRIATVAYNNKITIGTAKQAFTQVEERYRELVNNNKGVLRRPSLALQETGGCEAWHCAERRRIRIKAEGANKDWRDIYALRVQIRKGLLALRDRVPSQEKGIRKEEL